MILLTNRISRVICLRGIPAQFCQIELDLIYNYSCFDKNKFVLCKPLSINLHRCNLKQRKSFSSFVNVEIF